MRDKNVFVVWLQKYKDLLYREGQLRRILDQAFGRILADSANDLTNIYRLNVTSLAAFVDFIAL